MNPDNKIKFLNDLEQCVNDEIKPPCQPIAVAAIFPCLTIYTNIKNYYGEKIPDRQIESLGCDCPCVSVIYPYLNKPGDAPGFAVSIRCLNINSTVHIIDVPNLSKPRRMILKLCCQKNPFRIKCYASHQEAKDNFKKFIIQH